MITKESEHSVLTSFQTPKTMNIRANAKSFKIIASSLYKNIYKAILLEYSQNCFDSHIKAKNKDKFIIDLPTHFNPILRFTDFGTGMSPEFIEDNENGYLSVFSSTKDKSNKESGGWGCGRISILGIVDSYVLTTTYNKVKYIYNLFINEDGVPSLINIGKEDTQDQNGVVIECAVNNNDINYLLNNINVLKWFPNPPIVKNGDQIINIKPVEKSVIFGNGWYFPKEYQSRSSVHSGCYNYEIDPQNIQLNDKQKAILSSGIVLELPIGSISVNASRENIQWDNKTEQVIKNKLNDILIEIYEKYSKLILNQPNYYSACKEYIKILKPPEVSNTNLRCIFEEIDFKWNNKKVVRYINFQQSEIIPNPNTAPDQPPTISVRIFNECKHFYFDNYNERVKKYSITGLDFKENNIYVYKDCYISYWKTRIKEYCKANPTFKIIYIDANDINKFISVHNLEGIELVKISSLPKPVINRNTENNSEYTDNDIFCYLDSDDKTNRYNWSPIEDVEDFDKENSSKPIYYLPISGFRTILDFSYLKHLVALARKFQIIEKDCSIIGIKKGYCSKYIENKKTNYINFLEYVKTAFEPKMFDSQIIESNTSNDLYYSEILKNLNESNYLCPDFQEMIKNVKELMEIKNKPNDKYADYSWLRNMSFINFDFISTPIRKDVKIQKLVDKYPLLEYINTNLWGEQKVIDYINSFNK